MRLKFLEKFKKLKLLMYRYKITTSINNFFSKKYSGYNIEVNEDTAIFYAHSINKIIRKDVNCYIDDRYHNALKRIVKTKTVTTLSLIIILGLFVMSNYFIREITFSNESTFDYCVLEDVKKEIKFIGPFMRIEKDLNDLSNQLREKYSNYSYIGVRRRAGCLYIDIEKKEEYPDIKNDEQKPSDIVSNVDGKVVGFEVQSGVPVVGINQIIKKGDLLISGNVNYQIDPNNLSNLVHAQGIVLIEYAIYQEIIIPKVVNFKQLKYDNKKVNVFYLFNKRVGKNRVEEKEKYVMRDNIVDIKNIFRIEENVIYNIEEKNKVIEYKDAKVMSEQQIYSNFFKEKVSSQEKIMFMKFINFCEDENEYRFYYLLKYIKNATVKSYPY